jgi:hypothetical protein
MATHVEGTFLVTSWTEETYQESADGSKLTRARIDQTFDGGLSGAGTWESLMFYRADGTAVYTGLQRVVGRLGERSGSVVLRADGTYDGAVARTSWSIVPGSGTDGLSGLRGTGASAAPHGPNGTYALDFDID